MRAALGLDWNGGITIRTFFRDRCGRGGLLLTPEAVDTLHQQEHGPRDDQETDNSVNEHAVVNGDRSGGLRISERRIRAGFGAFLDDEKEVGEIDSAHEQPERRHEHIVDKALDDCAKSASDDDSDRHVNDVAAHGELFEFFQHDCLPLFFSFRWVLLYSFFAITHTACTTPGMYPRSVNRILSQKCLPNPTCRNTPNGGRNMASKILSSSMSATP